MEKKRKRKVGNRSILLIFIGVFAGIVLFAGTSEGIKYTDTAAFCSSCHVAEDAHDSFAESNHATLSCNDCHVPNNNIVSKLMYKGKSALGHVYTSTFATDDIPDVLHATKSSQEVVNENCIRCHAPTLENIEHHDVHEGSCIDCHRQVPHGKGTFYKSDDWHEPGDVDAKN